MARASVSLPFVIFLVIPTPCTPCLPTYLSTAISKTEHIASYLILNALVLLSSRIISSSLGWVGSLGIIGIEVEVVEVAVEEAVLISET